MGIRQLIEQAQKQRPFGVPQPIRRRQTDEIETNRPRVMPDTVPAEDLALDEKNAQTAPIPASQTVGGFDERTAFKYGSSADLRPRAGFTDNQTDTTDQPAPEQNQNPLLARRANLYAEISDLQDLKKNPIKNDDSRLADVWHGAQSGARIAMGTGNLGYTIGAITGGALRGLFDRKSDDKEQRQKDIAKKQAELEMVEKQISTDLDQQGKMLDQQGKIMDIGRKRLDAVMTANKPLWESITADGTIDKDEADLWQKTTGTPVNAYDAREFKETEIGGKTYTRPTKGTPNYLANPTLPVDRSKAPVDTTIKTQNGATTLPLTPSQAATTIVGVEQANANRQQAAAQNQQRREDAQTDKEYSDEKDYQRDYSSWQQRRTKAEAQRAKAQATLETAQQNKAKLEKDGYDTSKQDEIITAANGDLAEANVMLKEPAPKKIIRKSPSAPTKGKGKKQYSMSDIQRVINQ